MTVRLEGDRIRLEGDCRVEEAEELVALLEAQPLRSVDLSACRNLHGAVAQVLLVYRPTMLGEPQNPFLKEHVLPNFQVSRSSSGGA